MRAAAPQPFLLDAAPQPFLLRGEMITLDALLKATGLVGSGGQAKLLIAEGKVRVDGEIETRRGRKLRGGETVQLGSTAVQVLAAPAGATG